MTWLEFALATLGAWRLTSAVTTDTISERARRWLARRFPYRVVPLYDPNGDEVPGTGVRKPRLIVELVNCDRCLGWWIAGAVFGGMHGLGMVPDWKMVVLGWWGAAGAITVLSHFVG